MRRREFITWRGDMVGRGAGATGRADAADRVLMPGDETTAKALGLAVAPPILLRADKVIE
jgi:hypothetical protein